MIHFQLADYKIQTINKDGWKYLIFEKEIEEKIGFIYYTPIKDQLFLKILIEKLQDTPKKMMEYSTTHNTQRTFYFNVVDGDIKFLNLTL